MTAREYLQNLRKLNREINEKIGIADSLREAALSGGGMDYSRDRVQTSAAGDPPYVRSIDDLVDLEKEINADIDRYTVLREGAERWIGCLEDEREREVMTLRYIEDLRWDAISDRMHCRNRWTIRLHRRALWHMDGIYGQAET